MLLAIDIGNTNIVLGLWNGHEWLIQWRLRTVRDRSVDECGIYLKGLLRENDIPGGIRRIVMCSVVPQLTQTFDQACRRYLHRRPLIVTTELDLGIQNETDFPDQVGTDRLVNMAAAYGRYKTGCIVVDMGTATKLDVISSDGAFIGGVISPGLRITADALFQRAAKLGQVDLEAPPTAVGRNTVHAIQSGLVYGYISLIEGLVPRLRTELFDLDPHIAPIPVIGTGGLVSLLSPHTKIFDYVNPWLTLTGLQMIADRNNEIFSQFDEDNS